MTTVKPENPTNRCWLTLTGEIDLANAAEYFEVARGMIAECRPGSCFTIDLSSVTFMDSTGLGLLHPQRRLQRRDGSSLAETPCCVTRLLEVTGLDDHFVLGEPGP